MYVVFNYFFLTTRKKILNKETDLFGVGIIVLYNIRIELGVLCFSKREIYSNRHIWGCISSNGQFQNLLPN